MKKVHFLRVQCCWYFDKPVDTILTSFVEILIKNYWDKFLNIKINIFFYLMAI